MADPISLASGLLTLAAFALGSSKSIYQTVVSFQSNQRKISQLKQELESLDGVLESLHQAAANNNAALEGLKLPLLRCGKACRDFEAVIIKCTAHSGGSRTSFRDWAKLQYMGTDIAGFNTMLAGYKSTISIALGDATFRTTAVTEKVLKEYKAMIEGTTSDLEDHLKAINNKLETQSLQGARMSDEDAAERERIQEERDSTKQCLRICAQVAEHMNQAQPNVFENISTPSDQHQAMVATLTGYVSAKRATTEVLKECRERVSNMTTELESHLQEMDNRLETLSSRGAGVSSPRLPEQARIQEERDTVRQCLAICAQASEQVDQVRTNVFEDVSAAEDAHQVVVSTLGDLISATNISAGVRATQWLGQMADLTVQQLSRDRGVVAVQRPVGPQSARFTEFEHRYGAGYSLSAPCVTMRRCSLPAETAN